MDTMWIGWRGGAGTLWILQLCLLSSAVAEEYCNLETFRPVCPAGHVILITRAEYGRMQLGRCLKRDYYVGCSDDVRPILHQMCSGKAQCEVTLPNAALHRRQHCPEDLVSYLDAEYSCLKVSDLSNLTCRDGRREIPIETDGGFLAGRAPRGSTSAAAQTDCPIVLRAPRGQKINVTLYEFSAGDDPGRSNHGHIQCTVFATIQEYNGASFTKHVVCGSGSHRQELVYSSKTNQITVELKQTGSSLGDGGHPFLLQYLATGCADPVLPPDMTLSRRDEQLDVRCNNSGQVWHLVCRDNSWVGKFENCSTDYPDGYYQDTDGARGGSGFPNGIVMAIIVGIVLGVMIGFCLLLVVYNIRRRRRKQSQPRMNTADRQGQLKVAKLAESNYGPEDPMLPVLNPDVTMDKGCHMICDVTGTMVPRGRGDRDHVYEKPQSGMEVQCLLSSGQTKTQALDEEALMLKALDSGDYGCQFHTHKPWHIHGDTLEIVHPSKCALPT